LPTQLALSWEGKASFVLTESLVLKKVSYLDGVMDETSDKEDKFDADVVLSTGTLGPLLMDLVQALGGEMQLGATSPTSPPSALQAATDSPFV